MAARTIHATIDHRIRLRLGDIPDEADDAVIDALCIPNLEREKAKKHHVRGWEDLPEFLVMYGLTAGMEPGSARVDATIDLPRGFALDFVEGMNHFGVEVDFEDNRAAPAKFRVGKKISLYDDQAPLVAAILEAEQGIVKAPPGSGKTVCVLQAGRQAGTKCLIIVNTKDILNQWIARIEQHLGDHLQVGRIGDNEFRIGPIWTIATAQTLHSRYDQLVEDGFFDEFGFVCLDECHHATAETYLRLMDRFSSRIRIGVSATPDKTGDFQLAQLVLGPIIHTTRHEELVASGRMVKPKIIRVSTNFTFAFRGTKSQFQRSNYDGLIREIINDRQRCKGVVGAIMSQRGHHSLVLTKRYDHIDLLEAMLEDDGYPDPIYRLTGKSTNAQRAQALEALADHPCCVFSTLADEAVDVPRCDRVFLPFPQRNVGLIEQQMGRAERYADGKLDALIFDFVDLKVGVLKSQWRERRMKVYVKRKLEIENVDIEEFY